VTIAPLPADIEAGVRDILVSEFGADAALLSADGRATPLLGRGVGLDSIEALALATALESAFDVQIDDEELTVALFATLGTVVDFVERKQRDRGESSPGGRST
jgi:acyl carrier protein